MSPSGSAAPSGGASRFRPFASSLALLLLAGCASVPAGGEADSIQVRAFSLERPGKEAKSLRYLLVEPPKVEPGQRYPLVLFLHGANERGDDPRLLRKHFVRRMVSRAFRERFPCYVVAPQCPAEDTWSAAVWSRPESTPMPEEPTEPMRAVLAILEECLELPGVDRDRVYLTGLSMGGYGSWELAARRPELFAAVMPICGGGDERQAKRLAALNLWAFHGADDEVVPPECSRRMVDAIRAAGGRPRYTEYPDTGHDSWSPTYRDPDGPIAWMFAQRRRP